MRLKVLLLLSGVLAQGPTVGRFNKETSLSQAAWALTFLSRFLSCCLPPRLLCLTKPTHHALTTSTSVLTLAPYLLLRLPHSFHATWISTFAPGGLFLSSYKFLGPYLIQPNTRIPSANQSVGCCFLQAHLQWLGAHCIPTTEAFSTRWRW